MTPFKSEMKYVQQLVLGSALIFLGIMFFGWCFNLWEGREFIVTMWPVFLFSPSYLHIKQVKVTPLSLLIVGNSLILLLYTFKILNLQFVLGLNVGYTLIAIGCSILKGSIDSKSKES